MGSTAKVSDQLKVVRLQTSVTNHRFFNLLAMAVKRRLEEELPGLELNFGGKAASGSQMVASLTGQIIDADGTTGDKVRQIMDGMKNPADLLSTLKQV